MKKSITSLQRYIEALYKKKFYIVNEVRHYAIVLHKRWQGTVQPVMYPDQKAITEEAFIAKGR